MPPMQEAPDNGVCVHHSAMNKLIEETHAMTKIIHLKLGGDLDKKGMITEHCEMYEFFLEARKNKKNLWQHAATYMLSAVLGGLMVLIGLGIKTFL